MQGDGEDGVRRTYQRQESGRKWSNHWLVVRRKWSAHDCCWNQSVLRGRREEERNGKRERGRESRSMAIGCSSATMAAFDLWRSVIHQPTEVTFDLWRSVIHHRRRRRYTLGERLFISDDGGITDLAIGCSLRRNTIVHGNRSGCRRLRIGKEALMVVLHGTGRKTREE
ncbi:hypothetical protein L2E82_35333 [Cichorium intybus]|uniref:Uncharacterized protein n=1 Tax=Cichorium intybus TaxID=13427 RepID=A0ACB9BNL5_CICIN|nr:hypothetical protein L2E82_35333 [Cichorium intybus]